MTIQNPPIFIQAGSHPAEDVRRLFATQVHNQAGVVDADALVVTEKSGTPDMSVDVAGGRAYIAGDEATYQGTYFAENRGSSNIAVAASDPTNPRIDLVVLRVRDSAYSGGTDTVAIEVVTGTPAASPVAPTTPDNSLVLANVAVAALASSIVDANLTDVRTRSGQDKGNVHVFATVADRDAELTVGLTEGMVCYIQDITGSGQAGVCVYDGAAWQISWSEWINMVFDEVFEGITPGNGGWFCKEYRYAGVGLCAVRVGFIFGGSSSVTSTPVFVYPIPVDEADLGDNAAAAFNVQMKDNSTGDRYPGMLTDFNQNKGRIRVFTAGGTYAASVNTSASIPFTWATGDEIIISGVYPFATD